MEIKQRKIKNKNKKSGDICFMYLQFLQWLSTFVSEHGGFEDICTGRVELVGSGMLVKAPFCFVCQCHIVRGCHEIFK